MAPPCRLILGFFSFFFSFFFVSFFYLFFLSFFLFSFFFIIILSLFLYLFPVRLRFLLVDLRWKVFVRKRLWGYCCCSEGYPETSRKLLSIDGISWIPRCKLFFFFFYLLVYYGLFYKSLRLKHFLIGLFSTRNNSKN